MSTPEFKALLRKYNAGSCTDEERALIESWYMKFDFDITPDLTNEQIDDILAMKVPVSPAPLRKPLWRWVSVAATIFIVMSIGIYVAISQKNASEPVIAKMANDAKPGENKAILTLATGKKIALNDAQTGVIASEANATISKTADNQIIYSNSDGEEKAILFNTMSTPRGGQYHITLIDGTKVWLNAASSITYPTHFSGGERKVEINGEAYFEVAHMAKQPFLVVSKGQVIEVLGTHFNVNTYDDEPTIKTTLLEGSVRITALGKAGTLRPGEQSVVSGSGLKIITTDTEAAMSWHNGDFIFNSQTLEEIMRTVSRWYDIEVDYDNYKSTKQTFSGVVSRSRNLSAVIKMIRKSATTLKFEIRGNKVSISN